MGSDRDIPDAVGGYPEFQSTLPAWGATSKQVSWDHHQQISIHAPRMGSDTRLLQKEQHQIISIHAPRMGSDVMLMQSAFMHTAFQSTLPAWGATVQSKHTAMTA